jgi:hypothetical protein
LAPSCNPHATHGKLKSPGISSSGGYGVAPFRRYIGIDYSGAVTPESSCKGLRLYAAEVSGTPKPVPPPSPWRYWTRRGLAEWLCAELGADSPTLVGIDHGFSFPIAYFDRHRLPRDWPGFLVDLRPCALRGRRSIILAMQEVLSKTAEPEAPLEG